MARAPLVVARKDCERGCNLILGRVISYTEAAEALFNSQRKQEAYALSFLGMDELGKFLLIAKAMRSSRADPITVPGFFEHNPKFGEVLDYYQRALGSDASKLMNELRKWPGLGLSNASVFAYKAIESGAMHGEAKTIDANPLGYRNAAYYVDYDGDWKGPRYPGDEICAGQIKVVKGAAKGYQWLIAQNGLDWVLSQSHLFLP